MSIKDYILGLFLLMLSSVDCAAQLEWSLPTLSVDSGDVVAVDLTVTGYVDIISAQGTIEFDETVLEYTNAGNFELASISGASFGETQVDQGLLSFSWYESDLMGKDITNNATVLTLYFDVIGNPGEMSVVELIDQPVVAEFVDENFVTLGFTHNSGSVTVNNTLSQSEASMSSLEVIPNPITNWFKVDGVFYNDVLKINWFDLNGELVRSEEVKEGEMIARDLNLKRGSYFVQVIDGDIVYENRLIQLL